MSMVFQDSTESNTMTVIRTLEMTSIQFLVNKETTKRSSLHCTKMVKTLPWIVSAKSFQGLFSTGQAIDQFRCLYPPSSLPLSSVGGPKLKKFPTSSLNTEEDDNVLKELPQDGDRNTVDDEVNKSCETNLNADNQRLSTIQATDENVRREITLL